MSLNSYMRTTLLADTDPRKDEFRIWLEPATLDDVLAGIEYGVAQGYSLDESFQPFLSDERDCQLFGNFEDLSAAFSVAVPSERWQEAHNRIREAVRQSRYNSSAKAQQ